MLKNFLTTAFLIHLSLTSNCQATGDSAKANSITENGDKVFEKVEREAEFPGGVKAWIQYLEENLNSEVPIKKKAPAGTYQVIVVFIVSKSGKIKGISAETSHGYGMEKEVIRIIKKGPDWVPAMQDGHPVNAYRRQPVTFMISEE
jgi:protein TonB